MRVTARLPRFTQAEAKLFAPQIGMNQDVFTLEEGDVTIQWPKVLSQESFKDFEDWLELIKRKAKRAVSKPVNIGDL